MGWAKYYEDNMSICFDRMALKYETPKKKETPKKEETHITVVRRKAYQKGRRGLELSFQNGLEDKFIKKLQINGWWWSKANACWCNLDTVGNRRYAELFKEYAGMKLAIVTM